MKIQINKNKILKFLDKNLLLILSAALLVVIPLYPKLPLFDIIPGYIVRVRLEDFLILFTLIIFFIQLLRKKISLKTPLTKIIIAYAVIGLLSTLSGIFITRTIPTTFVHLSKSFLHYFRYLEYFSLFFIFYVTVKSRKDLKILLYTMTTTFGLVGIYGIGQKYLYWPVYSTMNREFSKGITLYLTEHARVQSTFGGHYDMAAYLVILLPLIFLLTKYAKRKLSKLSLWIIFSIGIWLMVMSASRTSFIAALASVFITILIGGIKEQTIRKKLKFIVFNSFLVGLLFMTIFSTFGEDISERLLQSLSSYPSIEKTYYQLSDNIGSGRIFISNKINELGLSDTIKIEKPKNGISTDQAAIIVASDTRPTPIKPSDVFLDIPDKIEVATISATGEKTTIIVEVPRTYSQNAIDHGLSLAIRLDTLWPQALNGFYNNPALGTGYATLTKSRVHQFTEADSTDNNFLRTLGETGLLGFITFYGAVLLVMIKAFSITFKNSNTKKDNKIEEDSINNNLKIVISTAFIGSSIGLLINALFIDVFAASKVALTFWSITGILFATSNIKDIKSTKISGKNSTLRGTSKIKLTKKKKPRKKRKKGQFKNTSK